MAPFLEALSRIPNVSTACRVANITRTQVYAHREKDTTFAAAFQDAREQALDGMEQEVHRRAMVGYDKTIVRTKIERDAQGNVIKETRTETTVHEVSDNLLLALLRTQRPERWSERYRPHQRDPDPHRPRLDDPEAIKMAAAQFRAEVSRLASPS